MKFSVKAILAVAALVCMIPAAGFAIDYYSQDFEGMDQADNAALASDGWKVFANVFGPDMGYLYGYGVYDAPNNSGAFSQIDINQGGAAQGMNQLVVFSDYNNPDHGIGNYIEANVFQERNIVSGDEGTYFFRFQGKLGNLEGATTAMAFIKTLDPNNGYATTNFIIQDMTDASADWNDYVLSVNVGPELVGQILQFGFSSTATNYQGSGVFYDNIDFYREGTVATEPTTLDGIKALYR